MHWQAQQMSTLSERLAWIREMAAFRQELASLKMPEGLCGCASLGNWNASERMSQHVEASVGERRVWPLDYIIVSFTVIWISSHYMYA